MASGPQGPDTPQNDEHLYQLAQQQAAAQPAPQPTPSAPVTPPPVDPQPPQPAPQAAPIMPHPDTSSPPRTAIDLFQQRGFPVSGYENDDQLMDDLVTVMQRQQQQIQDFERQAAEKQPAEPQPASPPQPEAPPNAFGLTPLSDRAAQLWDMAQLGLDKRGRMGIFNPYSGEYEDDPRYARELREIEEYQRSQRRASRELLENPQDALEINKLLERIDTLEKQFQDDSQQRNTQSIDDYVRQHQNEYYEMDPNGLPKVTMHEGRAIKVLNAKGRVQQSAYESMVNSGMSDHDAFWASIEASKHVPGSEPQSAGGNGSPEPAPQPTPAPAPQPFLEPVRRSQAAPVSTQIPQPHVLQPPQTVANAAAHEQPREPSDADLWRQAEEIARQQV